MAASPLDPDDYAEIERIDPVCLSEGSEAASYTDNCFAEMVSHVPRK